MERLVPPVLLPPPNQGPFFFEVDATPPLGLGAGTPLRPLRFIFFLWGLKIPEFLDRQTPKGGYPDPSLPPGQGW